MAVSPVATGCLIAGAALLARRLPLSPRALRYQARVAAVGGAGVTLLVVGSVTSFALKARSIAAALRSLRSIKKSLAGAGAKDLLPSTPPPRTRRKRTSPTRDRRS